MQRFVTLVLLATVSSGYASTELRRSDECDSVSRRAPPVEAACWSMEYGGRTRTVRLYSPKKIEKARSMIMVLHGGGGTAGNMERLTEHGFNRIADRDGVLIAYPEGIDKQWNDGRHDLNAKTVREHVDDVGFLRALAQALQVQFGLDARRVYATGISNGGQMSYRLACDAADTFAAIAPVAASISVDLEQRCKPTRPISVAILNGVDDPIAPWNGGTIKVLWNERGTVLSTPETVKRWLHWNRCAALQAAGSPINAVRDDGTELLEHRAECADRTVVALYEIKGGGHTWPDGEPYLGPRWVGRVSREFDANETIWAFFREQTPHQ